MARGKRTTPADTLVKYPRTPHLPWSRGRSADDVGLAGLEHFEGQQVVVTEKVDGECTTLMRDRHFARSLDSASHPSRTWLARLHGRIAHEIPEGWRVCGENAYARHSIAYDALPDYFLCFSIWDDQNTALSWDLTTEWCDLLGLARVPELYRGTFDVEAIRSLWPRRSALGGESEGYVVRLGGPFLHEDFARSVAKFVRPSHVQTDQHWMHAEIVPNVLADTQDQ